MDVLSIIDQAIAETGIEGDSEFVDRLRKAAPVLGTLAEQIRQHVAPEPLRNGSGESPAQAQERSDPPEPPEPEPGTFAHDVAAGIPVFVTRRMY